MTGELDLYALILLLGTLPTYVWRFVGVLVAQRLDPDSEVLRWVRAVASALVSALVARIALVPPDLLNSTTLVDRWVALLAGVAAYYAARRNIGIGVAASVATLFAAQLLV